jgi:hypothetical protein
MNSAPVLDQLPAKLPREDAIPLLPKEDSEPFGAILEEATENVEESDTDTSDVQEPTDSKEKKKEDPAIIGSLFCFCPPPTIDVPQPTVPSPTAQNVVSIPETTRDAKTPVIEQPSAATDQPLTQVVTPKATETTSLHTDGAFKLDPKLFQTVPPETASADLQITKAPQSQAPPVANASHGTLVAQLENRVKNSEKSAEFAPAPEQNMPVKGDLRRAVAEVSRVESFHAENKPSHVLSADFAAESREVIPVKSIQAAQLVESIRTEVATLRQGNDNTMTVVLRPDSGTQLSVNLSIARDGSVHAQARFDRGDFQSLQAQWPQLQQSLAAHGIRIADLSNQNQNSAQQHNHGSASAFQNPERGQNQQQQRNDAEIASFEDQFKASKQKLSSTTKPQPQPPARAASPTRRWQSWA